MFERKRYQFGYVRQQERKTGPHVWVWEYRDGSSSHSVFCGSQRLFQGTATAHSFSQRFGKTRFLSDSSPLHLRPFGKLIG